MAFYRLEKTIKLTDGYRKVFDLPGKSVLLMCEESEVYLLNNACPHLGIPLSNGRVREGTLRCLGHGIRFDLKTGQALQSTAPCKNLELFYPEYDNDYIGVRF